MSDEKNWLIRTRAKQILGPVSKKKIIEFVEKGSLAPEDEITMGNGYWITVKERELLDRYLYGDVPMEFNPIAEAKPVLVKERRKGNTASFGPNVTNKLRENKADDNLVPSDDDLAYPEETNQTDNTQFIKIPPKGDDPSKLPKNDDLAYPEVPQQKKK